MTFWLVGMAEMLPRITQMQSSRDKFTSIRRTARSRNSAAAEQDPKHLSNNVLSKTDKSARVSRENPRHNSLASHEIDALSQKCGFRVFQSYLENRKPAAGRVFWTYGPDKGDITILGVERHPEDQKRGAYQRIKLASLPRKKA